MTEICKYKSSKDNYSTHPVIHISKHCFALHKINFNETKSTHYNITNLMTLKVCIVTQQIAHLIEINRWHGMTVAPTSLYF